MMTVPPFQQQRSVTSDVVQTLTTTLALSTPLQDCSRTTPQPGHHKIDHTNPICGIQVKVINH